MAQQALRIIGRALLDLWENLFVLVAANLLWACSLLPAFGLFVYLTTVVNLGLVGVLVALALVALVTGPVTLGLFNLTVEVDRREKLEFADFWRGVKQYYRRGWLLGLFNAVFIVLSIVNFQFYTSPSLAGTPLALAIYLWVYIVFTWFVLQFYLWPLAVRMEKFTLGGLFRNGLLATFKYPGLSLVLGFIMAVVVGIGIVAAYLPLIMFEMVLIAIVGNKALTAVIEREQLRTETGKTGPTVDVPPLPEREPEPEPTYSTVNPPPGVKRRGQ